MLADLITVGAELSLPSLTFFPPAARHASKHIVCSPPAENWAAVLRDAPNMLISGHSSAANALLLEVTSSLHTPVCRLRCDSHLTFPSTPCGTLILDHVDALSRDQQDALVAWLDEPRETRTQLISVTTKPLYARVEAGSFLRTLYYRLNVLYFEVIPA
jgi:hypothetical protein